MSPSTALNSPYSRSSLLSVWVLCLSIAAGLIFYVIIPNAVSSDKDKSEKDAGEPKVENEGKEKETFPLHSKLQSQFVLDFESSMAKRLEAMERFSFPYNLEGVDKREKLSLEEFRAIYDGKWPVILTDVVRQWPAFNWTRDFFIQHYGHEKVAMKAVHETVSETLALPLSLYLSHLEHSSEKSWTYLTDELFLTQRPELRSQIMESVYTADNYFYLFPKDIQPWDCMLLWGTAFSRSSLHIDPYNWTGTNAVISGKKLWKLIPPGQDAHLAMTDLKNCGFPMDCVKYNSPLDAFDPDTLEKLREKVHILEFEQNPGEILFIPTGWYHQAFNAVPTLAVSGQLMNANNHVAVLEEVIKGGTVQRSALPPNAHRLDPKMLVSYIASKIPPQVVKQGAQVTANALKQMEANSRRSHP